MNRKKKSRSIKPIQTKRGKENSKAGFLLIETLDFILKTTASTMNLLNGKIGVDFVNTEYKG